MKAPNRTIEQHCSLRIFDLSGSKLAILIRKTILEFESALCATRVSRRNLRDRKRDEQSRAPGLFDYLTNEARHDRFEANRESRRDRWRLTNFKSDTRSSQGRLRRNRLRSAENCTLSQYYISRRVCFDLHFISETSMRNVATANKFRNDDGVSRTIF